MKLRPAQQISENEISDALHISRTPVREAFIRLAEDGLLKITPQKRTVVSPISLQQADQARFIRRAIEKAVMKEACGRLGEPAKIELRANVDEQVLCRTAAAHDRMLFLDDEFHRTIFKSCGKELSWLYIQKLDYNYDRLRALALPRIIGDIVAEHEEILEAITVGRVESIDALVEQHMGTKAIDRAIRECPRDYFDAESEPAAARPAAPEKGGDTPARELRLQHAH